LAFFLNRPFWCQKLHFKHKKRVYFQHTSLIVKRSPWPDFSSSLAYNFIINRYYHPALINKAELVADKLQTPKRGNLKLDLNLRQLRQKFVGGALATVAFDVVQGSFVPLLGMGGTGIGHQRY